MPPLSAAASGDYAREQSVPAERDTQAERNNSVERVQKRRLALESASPSRALGTLRFRRAAVRVRPRPLHSSFPFQESAAVVDKYPQQTLLNVNTT